MKSNHRSLVAALALAAVSAVPAAAEIARPIRFEHLSADEGLSQVGVMDVLQDRRGYIWLATEDGLNRYDGTSFKVYRHDASDLETLPDPGPASAVVLGLGYKLLVDREICGSRPDPRALAHLVSTSWEAQQ